MGLSKWNVSKVTKMNNMFANSNFDGDLSEWDVSQVTNMEEMFLGNQESRSKFNGNVSKWDVSKVTSMREMFYGALNFDSDLSKWDISKVTKDGAMFVDRWTCLKDTGGEGPCDCSAKLCDHVPSGFQSECRSSCTVRAIADKTQERLVLVRSYKV